MAHGTPDWGLTAGTVTTYQLTDLAELAARLGSIVTFDRRGEVVFFDAFEDGLHKWRTIASGAGATVALSVATARSGRVSADIIAGSNASRLGGIGHRFPVLSPSRIGLEAQFSNEVAIETLDFALVFYDGATMTRFVIRWSDTDNELLYLNSAGVYTPFATGINLIRSFGFYPAIKFIIDSDTLKYVRVLFNVDAYALSGIAGQSSASALLPHIDASIELTGRSGFNDNVYVDDVILTQNEPV